MQARPRPGRDAPRSSRSVVSWCLYDFANSAFTTVVVTFVYANLFRTRIAPSEGEGFSLWTWGIALTGILVALGSPVLGAVADRGGLRKRFLLVSTLVAIAATALLYAFAPGQAIGALVVFVIANIAFEMANVFYNAFLPDIAPPERIGRISGYGWSLGYLGGLLAMLAALFLLVRPDPPLFGLDAGSWQHVRATLLLVAGWYALFSVPLFLWVREDRSRVSPSGTPMLRATWTQLRDTFREIRRHGQVLRLLVARLVYNDGLVTVFALGGIYAAGKFDFNMEKLIGFGLYLNSLAGLGAYAFGFFDDRLGGKATILVSLVALVVATSAALVLESEPLFWAAAGLLGIFVGPNQAASRSLMGRFVPPDKENEFFGFFAFSGKATSFLGPLLVGRVADLVRGGGLAGAGAAETWGMATVLLFFVVGGLVLLSVNEAKGIEAAGRGG